jgi:hypothetical protein
MDLIFEAQFSFSLKPCEILRFSNVLCIAILFIKVLLPTDTKENCFTSSIKIYIKTAPTYFGVITIIRERTI